MALAIELGTTAGELTRLAAKQKLAAIVCDPSHDMRVQSLPLTPPRTRLRCTE